MFGAASSGIGTRGWSTTGTALYASTSGPKIGVALRAIGRVKLENCCGVATIASGANSVTSTATVKSVAVNAAADTFTIYLTAAATATVMVAWHVFG